MRYNLPRSTVSSQGRPQSQACVENSVGSWHFLKPFTDMTSFHCSESRDWKVLCKSVLSGTMFRYFLSLLSFEPFYMASPRHDFFCYLPIAWHFIPLGANTHTHLCFIHYRLARSVGNEPPSLLARLSND